MVGRSTDHFEIDADVFAMDTKWIVRGQPDGSIQLRDRWTLEIVRSIQPPSSIYEEEDRPLLICVQFNDRYLVAVYSEYRGTCVWDIRTFQLVRLFDGLQFHLLTFRTFSRPFQLHVYDDGWTDFQQEDNFHRHPVSFNMTHCVRLFEDHLITIGHVWTPDNPSVRSLAVFSHRISDKCTAGHHDSGYRHVLTGPAMLVNHGLDSRFSVVLLERIACQDPEGLMDEDVVPPPPPGMWETISLYEVQIRSADNFDHLRTIRFRSSRYCYFDYQDGLMVTGLTGNNIRLWNVEKGHCIRNLLNEGPLAAVR